MPKVTLFLGKEVLFYNQLYIHNFYLKNTGRHRLYLTSGPRSRMDNDRPFRAGGTHMGSRLLRALATQPPIEPLGDPAEVRRTYRFWRIRMMYSMLIGYAGFYLVRKNFSMAMPVFLEELDVSRTDLGLILSAFSIVYGVGKFANGMLADRANPRFFMAIGLAGAAAMNLCFGFSSALWTFGLFWLANAWFQSMGWPPCARLLTHWYSASERGTMWGLWNASHQIGGAAILVLAGTLITHLGWRAAFIVPAVVTLVLTAFLVNRLRDTPRSLGLPPVESYRGERVDPHEAEQEPFFRILRRQVLNNPAIWVLCLANFFIYVVRIGILDWAPTYLVEAKNSQLEAAGWQVAGFEIAGIFGALAAGWFSDRLFSGRRGPVAVIWLALLAGGLFGLWRIPPGNPWLDAALLMVVGFLVYGPQMLVGVAAADFASKKAVATATGLTGTFGYLGSGLCGVGTGVIVDRWGWDGAFVFFITSAVIATALFALLWNKRADSLQDRPQTSGR